MTSHVSDILAAVALALSLALTFIEVRRRLYGLHFEITDTKVIDAQANTIYLLLGLTIVNPSTITKTIYRIDSHPLKNYQISEVTGEQNFEQSLVTFQPLGIAGRGIRVRLDDTASFPLDVEPHHSKLVYLGIAVSPIPPSPPQVSTLPKQTYGYLLGFDYRQKQIAKIALKHPA